MCLKSPAHARGWARATFDELRSLTRRHRGTVHLFLHAPLGGTVLLGNLWNRTPTTQLYDDLGPGRGYTPTFPLPGIAEAPRRVQRPGFRIARLSRASRVTLRERDQPRAIHACGSMLLGDAHKRQALHISSSSGVGGRRVARRPRGAKAFQDPANPRAGDPQERRSGSAAPDCSVGLLAAVSTRVTGAGETAPTERFRQSAGRGCPASAGLLLPFRSSSVGLARSSRRDCCLTPDAAVRAVSARTSHRST
jgi:hypothetical protein